MPPKHFTPPKGWIEYRPGRRNYPGLTLEQAEQLGKIQPSRAGEVLYRPCELTMGDGSIVRHAYVLDANTYIRWWGVWPSDDQGKTEVDLSAVVDIRESPHRLPVRFAEELYSAGESSMGGVLFTVTFSGGLRQIYETGSLVDFIPYPAGLSPRDVVGVEPHAGRDATHRLPGLPYSWCLHGVGESNSVSWRLPGDA